MPIPVDLQPPPQFDRSLLGYATINFNRLRDAFRFAFGGDYQTGVVTVNFPAVAAVQTITNFPVGFNNTAGPCMILTPIDNGAFPGLVANVDRATVTYFIHTITAPFAINGNVTARWVAFYP